MKTCVPMQYESCLILDDRCNTKEYLSVLCLLSSNYTYLSFFSAAHLVFATLYAALHIVKKIFEDFPKNET